MLHRGVSWAWLLVLGVALPVWGQVPPPPDPDLKPERLPKLVVAERGQDLGTFFAGEKQTAVWLLRNEGDADLVIEKTLASCGCAVVKLAEEQKTIPPGGRLDFKVEFDSSGRRGKQKKTVTVMSNDPVEPKLTLTFEADVRALFEMMPNSTLALRQVRRGETARRTVDVVAAQAEDTVEILSVRFAEGTPLTHRIEPLESRDKQGWRVLFTVNEDAALGSVTGSVHIKIKTKTRVPEGDKLEERSIEQERELLVRADIVGDLIVLPKVVDATRQRLLQGQGLAPVKIASSDRRPFDILSAEGGPLLEVTVAATDQPIPRIEYRVTPRVREDAAPGPFGAMLRIRTDSLDQPVITVPVYGLIVPAVELDPEVVLLRHDGTPAGKHRRVRLMCSPREVLGLQNPTCENSGVRVRIEEPVPPAPKHDHLSYLDVELVGTPEPGTHETVITVQTGVAGASSIEIPVTIIGPRG